MSLPCTTYELSDKLRIEGYPEPKAAAGQFWWHSGGTLYIVQHVYETGPLMVPIGNAYAKGRVWAKDEFAELFICAPTIADFYPAISLGKVALHHLKLLKLKNNGND